jgi:hypothetical protein
VYNRRRSSTSFPPTGDERRGPGKHRERRMPVNNIIYLVGLVVVIIAILSFFGLR